MVSIAKIIGVMSCSVVLCLSLSNVTQATGSMGPDPCADRKGGEPNLVKCDEETRQGSHTIKGEVLRVEPSSYFVQQYDGDQVSVHTDATTQMTGNIRTRDHIEAKVNAQSHALSIRQAK
jgi:hypothetical protein